MKLPIKVGDKIFYIDKDIWKTEKAFREGKERKFKPVSLR